MDIKIYPSKLSGEIAAVPSKSAAHRALICAALANAPDFPDCVSLGSSSNDIDATIDCLNEIHKIKSKKLDLRAEALRLRCRESASTYRFLLPVVSALGLNATYILEGRLSERPLLPLYEDLRRGRRLTAGTYTLDAGVSSQFISGLLFALPLLEGDSEIHLTGELESAPYVNMTVDMLRQFGVKVTLKDNSFFIPGMQTYKSPGVINIEGDWSNAAFWLCAGVKVTKLDMNSKQGDRAIAGILARQGDIDARDIPDLVPILAVNAAVKDGITRIYNAGRLRIKESDRLAASAELLNTLGGKVIERQDGLEIHGVTALTGGTVSSWGDHRIAMSAAIAATKCINPVIIKGAEAVSKSYPGFFRDFMALGGQVQWLHNSEKE